MKEKLNLVKDLKSSTSGQSVVKLTKDNLKFITGGKRNTTSSIDTGSGAGQGCDATCVCC